MLAMYITFEKGKDNSYSLKPLSNLNNLKLYYLFLKLSADFLRQSEAKFISTNFIYRIV